MPRAAERPHRELFVAPEVRIAQGLADCPTQAKRWDQDLLVLGDSNTNKAEGGLMPGLASTG